MDLTKLMEEDISPSKNSVENLNHEGLKSVAEVAKNIRDKEELIFELEEKLSEEKKALFKLTDEDLPAMFLELGLNKLELADGSTVEVKQTYGASIKVDNRPAAYDWLREHDYDDIIKNTVACNFGRG
jgi:predicted RNase H-like nuclease (RuvC/YqgF family)